MLRLLARPSVAAAAARQRAALPATRTLRRGFADSRPDHEPGQTTTPPSSENQADSATDAAREARIKKRGSKWEDSEGSQSVSQMLDSLQIVPFGENVETTALEAQDRELRDKLKLYKTRVEIRKRRPISNSMRMWRTPVYPYLHKGKPVWQLTVRRRKKGGRNNTGRIVHRHRGGEHARRIRQVDYFRLDAGEQVVQRIEYDPNRTAHIALVKHTETGALSYILAHSGMRAGDVVESFRQGIPQRIIDKMGGKVDPGILATYTARKGNCLPLNMIPLGTIVHNIGLSKVGPGKFCRAAGTYGRLFDKVPEKKRAVIKLQSGEVRYVALDAPATIGIVSNPDHQHAKLGKAGRARNRGIRPCVRGVVRNKVDHPMGGGTGKTKSNRIPVSPWGVQAKSGFKTRKGKNVNREKIRDRPRGNFNPGN